jgi:hypothetical protein
MSKSDLCAVVVVGRSRSASDIGRPTEMRGQRRPTASLFPLLSHSFSRPSPLNTR